MMKVMVEIVDMLIHKLKIFMKLLDQMKEKLLIKKLETKKFFFFWIFENLNHNLKIINL